MGRIILAVCLLVSLNCFAGDYVRVTGNGSSMGQAKQDAFRKAIQIKVGVVVLSQQSSNGEKLDLDKIDVYSAGYIKDYMIVGGKKSGGGNDGIRNESCDSESQCSFQSLKPTFNGSYTVTMDVLVDSSKLVNQTLNTGKTEAFVNGQKLSDTIESYRDMKDKGNRIVADVLQTYPVNAFVIKTENYTVGIDSNQVATLQLPYVIRWNYDYIQAFNEAMSLVQDSKLGLLEKGPANVFIMAKDPKDLVLGKNNHYKFSDVTLIKSIERGMIRGNELRMEVILRDGNNSQLYRGCFLPVSFTGASEPLYGFAADTNSIVIFGNAVEKRTISIPFPKQHEHLLKKLNSINVNVIAEKNCN